MAAMPVPKGFYATSRFGARWSTMTRRMIMDYKTLTDDGLVKAVGESG